MYEVRLANVNDIDKIMEIRWMATKLLKGNGIDQWQNEYPAPEDFKKDIDKSQLYVVTDGDEIAGFCVLSDGYEPSYEVVYDGEGFSDYKEYLVYHRLAVNERYYGKGVAKHFIAESEKIAKARNVHSLRFDTHAKNITTQNLFKKNGFKHVGTVKLLHVTVGDPERLVFEKII